jgi:murein peptide amidase A
LPKTTPLHVLRCVSPHDYSHLIKRWRLVARRAGLRLRTLCQTDGGLAYYLQSPTLTAEGGLYISAGIHGDEAAGTEALLAWAESWTPQLRGLPLLLFPCLNPWGLIQNQRSNAAGVDLNRAFHRRLPLIRAVRKVVGTRRFAACVHLHEDFDGEGLYLYELVRGKGWGADLLREAAPVLPIDPRRRIDRWHAKNGLIARKVLRRTLELIGYPEACWLWFEHTDRALTVETPSEFAMECRVAAQVTMLNEILRRACGVGRSA